jgi:hypothetical protein
LQRKLFCPWINKAGEVSKAREGIEEVQALLVN